LERFTSAGAPDTTFGSNGTAVISGLSSASAVMIHPNTGGEFDVAGVLETSTTDWSGAVARLQVNGSLDTSFGANGGLTSYFAPHSYTLAFNAMALESDGNIVVTGDVSTPTASRAVLVVSFYGASSPQIGSFTATPNPVASGASVTFTVSNVVDPNPNGSITQVGIYLDSNNDGKLDSGDTLLGYATQTSPGVWTFTFTVNLAPGTYTIFAQAEDNYGLFSDPFALTLTVQ
jgi:hypothetical protein